VCLVFGIQHPRFYKEEAAALRDMDDADQIRKEVEKSAGKPHRRKEDD
jgi:hypothetical protein